jgi:hypothetical protein
MRGRRPGAILPAMESATKTIILELRVDDGHLTGRATNVHGTRRDFDGWLGLIGAIDSSTGFDARGTTPQNNDIEEIHSAHR